MDSPSRRQALAELYTRHYGELVRLGFALTGDWELAEDFAQEAFIRAWRRWGSIRREQAAPAYLRTTVVNLARTSFRQRLREGRFWKERPAAHEADITVNADIIQALRRLPARKRACVVLRFYADLSEVETAETLGIAVGTVKSQTAKALRQLRSLLAEPEVPSQSRPGRDHGGV